MQHIFKNRDISINLKSKLYDVCILPLATYGLETMAITKPSAKQLRTTQRDMEPAMVGVYIRYKIKKEIISKRTRITDIIKLET